MKLLNVLASVALIAAGFVHARPSRLARRVAARASRRSNLPQLANNVAFTSNVSHELSENWAGSIIESPPSGQTFKTVTGTFEVPSVSGSGAASAWVGIESVDNSMLSAGIDFDRSGSTVTYDAWTEWFPDYASDIGGFTISQGNSITVTVTANSSTAGAATFTNHATGQTTTISLRAPSGSVRIPFVPSNICFRC
jgi:hypothetical protein